LWDLKSLAPQNPFPQYLHSKNPDWQLTQALITAIRGESESHGARFLLVILPQRDYLNGFFDPTIYGHIETFAKASGITYINMLPKMRSYHWADIFYPEDGHFTPYGASIAAQIIAQKLQEIATP
jgi:hypothetical protein